MKREGFEYMFGIEACKDSIKFREEYFKQSLEDQLKEYEERAKTDITFNKTMIEACKELIEENKKKEDNMCDNESLKDFVLSGIVLNENDTWLHFRSKKAITKIESGKRTGITRNTCYITVNKIKSLIPQDKNNPIIGLNGRTGFSLEELINDFKVYGVDLEKHLNFGNETKYSERLK